jgi:EAL domain-containing protein (putative c-di-GMP-specific phosphodiesterase class I)
LRPGDVLRFADMEFRLRRETGAPAEAPLPDITRTSFFRPDAKVDRLPIGARQFEQLLRDRLITPLFQPIVSASENCLTGLELLGRGNHPGLSELPEPLFALAEGLGRAVELSEAIREVGVACWASSRFCDIPLFMNTHPRELNDCARLSASLQALRRRYPHLPMVLEIHEQAVTEQHTLDNLNSALQRMDIGLAYDDFGAGQARLLELLNVPPYAVKFDIALIRDLEIDQQGGLALGSVERLGCHGVDFVVVAQPLDLLLRGFLFAAAHDGDHYQHRGRHWNRLLHQHHPSPRAKFSSHPPDAGCSIPDTRPALTPASGRR